MNEITKDLLQAVALIQKSCEQEGVKPGIVNNLAGTKFLIQKILRSGEPRKIGFFGAQKRGKSSLINLLLGCDLMPVSPIPMSSVVIEVHHDESKPKDEYDIDVIGIDGDIENSKVSLKDAQEYLKEYGSHKGISSSNVDTIRITSNFSESVILQNGGVLVDTPGAEMAFGETAGEDGTQDVTSENRDDVKRATNILKSTHVVIFVERADVAQSENSRKFFTEHLRNLRPFSVVNWKDSFQLDSRDVRREDANMLEIAKQSKMREIMLKTFGVNLERVLCVSSKEARDAKKSGDDDALERSNIPSLEKNILRELENLSSEKGLKACLRELEKNLEQLGPEKAEKVFANAKTPFYRMMCKLNESHKEDFTKIAGGIYEQYSR